MKFAATLILALLCFFSPTVNAQYARAEPYETAITQIQKAMTPSESGIQHVRWVSLRLLADPAMNPLFEYLIAQKNIPLRIDGFMGVALVSADKSLDAARINQFKDPALRSLLITEALGLDLLKPAALNIFFQAQDLTNYERALLVGELNRQEQPWDKSLLADAPFDNAAEVAGLASMLLLERGDDGAWQALARNYKSFSLEDQVGLHTQLATAARQYRIVAAVAPLLDITKDSLDGDRLAVITTAAALAPKLCRPVVLEKLKSDRSQTTLVRMGLLMLSTKDGFEAADFEQLRNGDPMVEAMANVGVAMRTKSADRSTALNALLENGNRLTSEYVLSLAATLPPEISRPLLLSTINRIAKGNSMANVDLINALLAVQQLLRMPGAHPELLTVVLEQMDKNIALVETIMSVVADSSNPEAALFARSVRGKLPRRGESMALLALAKSNTPLTDAEITELGSIASGGGKVDDSSQIQAAWLYLKYAKRDKDAVTQLTR